MAKQDKYFYECPYVSEVTGERCGSYIGTSQVPLGGPPWCQNHERHHSKKSYVMTFIPSKSKEEEPNPYPKSKKKVLYT